YTRQTGAGRPKSTSERPALLHHPGRVEGRAVGRTMYAVDAGGQSATVQRPAHGGQPFDADGQAAAQRVAYINSRLTGGRGAEAQLAAAVLRRVGRKAGRRKCSRRQAGRYHRIAHLYIVNQQIIAKAV